MSHFSIQKDTSIVSLRATNPSLCLRREQPWLFRFFVAKRSRIWLYQYRYDVAAFVLIPALPSFPPIVIANHHCHCERSVAISLLAYGTGRRSASPTGVVAETQALYLYGVPNPRCSALLVAKRSRTLSFPHIVIASGAWQSQKHRATPYAILPHTFSVNGRDGMQVCIPYKTTQTNIVIPSLTGYPLLPCSRDTPLCPLRVLVPRHKQCVSTGFVINAVGNGF